MNRNRHLSPIKQVTRRSSGNLYAWDLLLLIVAPRNREPWGEQSVLHAPVNISGTATELVEGLRVRGIGSDAVFWKSHPFWPTDGYVVHRNCHRILFFFVALRHYSVFHFYYGLSLLPRNVDLPILRLLGKRIFMNYVGSDARITSLDVRRNPYATLYFGNVGDKNHPSEDARKLRRLRWHALWATAAISGPSIRLYLEGVYASDRFRSDLRINNLAAWRHTAPIRANVSSGTPECRQNAVVHVVHAPSNPLIKGTDAVRAAILQLQREMPELRYTELTGVASAAVVESLASADIVVDQLLLGGIGTLAWEAMLLGKPVVAHITDQHYAQDFMEGSICRATVDNLIDVLRRLAKSEHARQVFGDTGRLFAESELEPDRLDSELIHMYLHWK